MKNPSKTFKILIIFCWTTLIAYVIIKIHNDTLFELHTNNQSFINFCNKVDNTTILQIIIGLISSYICYSLMYLAMIGKYWLDKLELIIFIPVLCITTVVKVFNNVIGIVFDIIMSLAIPMLFLKKNNFSTLKAILTVIYGNVLDISFQMLSLFTRNLNPKHFLTDNGSCNCILFSIDVYIMLLLYYLYSNKKRTVRKNELDV